MGDCLLSRVCRPSRQPQYYTLQLAALNRFQFLISDLRHGAINMLFLFGVMVVVVVKEELRTILPPQVKDFHVKL